MKRFLAVILFLAACASPSPTPQTAPETPLPAEAKSIGTVRVTATTLNVRQEPSTTAAVVSQVVKGDQLTLLAVENGWSQVKLASGEVGWVSSQHVSSAKQRLRKGCQPDSNFSFVKAPLASFSESGPHGLVVIDANVNTSGDVIATKVISNSTGDETMAKTAEREIRSAKFAPPYRDCVPRAFIFTYKRSF